MNHREDVRSGIWRTNDHVGLYFEEAGVGRHSGALPGCRYAGAHIPGARLEIFEASHHAPFYTEADKFNRLVADFVRHPIPTGASDERPAPT